MLIKQLTITDYGPYAGSHVFDFTISEGKPIILIGGRNGGGKTTLFESIPLCLYGQYGSNRKAYKRRLQRLIHRSNQGGLDSDRLSSVQIIFEISHRGNLTEYVAKRSWRAAKGDVREKFQIKRKSGDSYQDIDFIKKDQQQSFVNDQIPKGIMSLFFFDGEEISRSAEEGESVGVRTAFNALLGLDIVEQLQKDLQTNLVRNLGAEDRHIQTKFDELEKQKEHAEQLTGQTQESLAQRRGDLRRIREEVRAIDDNIDNLGGSFAASRQETKIQLAGQETEAAILAKDIAKMCASELPLGLVPAELAQIRQQINLDVQAGEYAAQKKTVQSILDYVAEAMSDMPDVSDAAKSTIIRTIRKAAPQDTGPGSEVLGFSSRQRGKILHTIQNISPEMLNTGEILADRYDAVQKEISRLELFLTNTPADDEIGPLVSKSRKLHADAGRAEAEIERLEMQIATRESEIRHINAKIKEVLQNRYKSEKGRRAAELTKKVLNILDLYIDRLRASKIDLLESYVQETIRTLMHKQDLIDGVSIDLQTFEVSIYDENRNKIPRGTLSKGELQMVWISMLWALAKTSGRPLPFVIDTPLARLDAEHRANLTTGFFPLASHQILLFSTNTEIGSDEYAKLYEYVSRSYIIQYNSESAGTEVREGYFWDRWGNEIQ